LEAIITTLSDHQLHINRDKSNFFQSSVIWVGHEFTSSNTNDVVLHPRESTLDLIKSFPKPHDRKTVQAFLGHFAYISNFLSNYATTAAPLYALVKKDTAFNWTADCENAFHQLLQLDYLQLNCFTPELPIKVTTDASNVAIGAVLWQQFEDNWKPICFKSQKLTTQQLHWSVLDKEMYAIKFACINFCFYLHL